MQPTKPANNIREKLIKLFNFNKNNKEKKNDQITKIISDSRVIYTVYKAQLNKNLILNKTSSAEIKTLSKQFKKGVYFWQKSNSSLKNKIFVKLMKLILITVYEPIFNTLNYNFGFRPIKNTRIAIKHLSSQNLKIKLAFKGEIQKTNMNTLNPIVMLKILRKRIIDPPFLNLIKTILKNLNQLVSHSIYSILFNIYTHEFDLYISKKIKQLNLANETKIKNFFKKHTPHVNSNAYKLKAKRRLFILTDKIAPFNIKEFQNLTNQFKIYKKKQMVIKINSKQYKNQMLYNRYYNH